MFETSLLGKYREPQHKITEAPSLRLIQALVLEARDLSKRAQLQVMDFAISLFWGFKQQGCARENLRFLCHSCSSNSLNSNSRLAKRWGDVLYRRYLSVASATISKWDMDHPCPASELRFQFSNNLGKRTSLFVDFPHSGDKLQ